MKFHFWYTVLSILFVALAGFGYSYLAATGKLGGWIPLADFFLIVLAVQRLVRLFAYDAVTALIREWFTGARPDSFRDACSHLITCPWCLGLWFSLVVTFFYLATPMAWYAILVLAISSLASLVQIFSNFLGWSAELKKRQAQEESSVALPR